MINDSASTLEEYIIDTRYQTRIIKKSNSTDFHLKKNCDNKKPIKKMYFIWLYY